MVDTYGRWTEEADYSTFPERKMCDYDRMAVWIRNKGYEPKTSMENLISMMFLYYDSEMEQDNSEFDLSNFEDDYVKGCQSFVEVANTISDFDFTA